MPNTVIKVENLSKQYRLGMTHSDLLSEKFMQGARGLVRTIKGFLNDKQKDNTSNRNQRQADYNSDVNLGKSVSNKQEKNCFWALRNVSFEVKQGEVLGVIGRNGAGKSTLLKILSEITEPTNGRAVINGRVGSLLEVGTGFHPELTGKENIYLNGSILGMNRTEIRNQYDEIVSFAEIEKFIDTPVKRYSSGMYVRLAFAVAAHLKPEILLIDEVLAVGDFEFQKKCLGKMDKVAKQGRTIIFVSHNMNAVQSLCNSAIILDSGMIKFNGSVDEALVKYLKTSEQQKLIPAAERTDRGGSGRLRIVDIKAELQITDVSEIVTGDSIEFIFSILNEGDGIYNAVIKTTIYDNLHYAISHMSNLITGDNITILAGLTTIRCVVRDLPLSPGIYYINASLDKGGEILDRLVYAYQFRILPNSFSGSGFIGSHRYPPLILKHAWKAHSNSKELSKN